MSFRRKESSENQIKELFITSPMVSSPDFDKQDNCRGVDNKENFSYSKFNNKRNGALNKTYNFDFYSST